MSWVTAASIPGPRGNVRKGPLKWGKRRHKNRKKEKSITKLTEAVVQQQNVNAEEKETVKTRTEFPETWLWQTIKLK